MTTNDSTTPPIDDTPPFGGRPVDETISITPEESVSSGRPVADPVRQSIGHYQLLGVLGRGGMGTVYEAVDESSGRRVAVKLLTQRVGPNDPRRERFLREGRLAAAVSHPNSVYVFGTEEIGDDLIIVMELAYGGNLADRVRATGPLEVTDAVEYAIELLDGLAAAHDANVLHRDIKPSNCFLDRDDRAKIGDYGLSVSSNITPEPDITQPDTFIGTPAYAPPEQFRGDPVDERSDLYSIAATLYFFLTGHAPFEGAKGITLIATILEKPVPPISIFRSDAPSELESIILRALDKDPARRPADARTFQSQLRPFGRRVDQPAGLLRRFVSGIVDSAIVLLPMFVASTALAMGSAARETTINIASLVISLLYSTLFEGLWGTTPGKFVVGLRVVGVDRVRPGVPRALFRAVVFSLPMFSLLAGVSQSMTLAALSYLFIAALFLTCWRRTDRAAIHDLVSGTRVVSARTTRSELAASRRDALPVAAGDPIGAFRAVPRTIAADAGTVDGVDERLKRPVWIRRSPVAVPQARMDIARITRTRWLGGSTIDGQRWDVFEAPPGRPFTDVVQDGLSWSELQPLLSDLAEEWQIALRDGTAVDVVSPERLWISGAHAMVLDSPPPDTRDDGLAEPGPQTPDDVAKFLRRVALSALDERWRTADDVAMCDLPLPSRARAALDRLGTETFDEMDSVAAIVSDTATRARLTPRLRATHLMSVYGSTLAFVALVFAVSLLFGRVTAENRPASQLIAALEEVERAEAAGDDMAAVWGAYISHSFADGVRDSSIWGQSFRLTFIDRYAARAESVIARYPSPDSARVEALIAEHEELRSLIDEPSRDDPSALQLGFATLWLTLVGIGVIGLIASVALGRSPVLSAFDLEVITRNGRRAGRARLFGRSLLSLLPLGLPFLAAKPIWGETNGGLFVVLSVVVLVVYLVGVVGAVRRPSSSPLDRVARTAIVAR